MPRWFRLEGYGVSSFFFFFFFWCSWLIWCAYEACQWGINCLWQSMANAGLHEPRVWPWISLEWPFRSQLFIWVSSIHSYATYVLLVLIGQAYKHIFTSPSSMEKAVKATRSGKAWIHGMKRVTTASLAYIATQVRLVSSFCCYTTDHLAAPLYIVIFLSLLQDWHYHGLRTILWERFGLLGRSRWEIWYLWTAGLVELVSALSGFEFHFQANASIFG